LTVIFSMKTNQMLKKEAVKKKIGKAAMQCFRKYGLEKTTLDDIAKAAGMSKTGFYYYFKNKEDIFLETAFEEGWAFLADLQKKTARKKDIGKKIWYYLQSRFLYYEHVLRVSKVNTVTLNTILPSFFNLYDEMREKEKEYLKQVLQLAVAQGALKKINTAQTASLLINVSDALKHSTEQKSILRGEEKVDYRQSMADLKLFVDQVIQNALP